MIYATHTGGALRCAACLRRIMQDRQFSPRLYNASQYPAPNLIHERRLLLIVATRDGHHPTSDCERFFDRVAVQGRMDLRQLQFSVAAINVSPTASGVHPGILLDEALASQGASQIFPRLECDRDFETPFFVWASGALAALRQRSLAQVLTQ